MIDLLPPDRYDAIISNAGGCGSHLRRYGPLLADDPAYAERAQRLGLESCATCTSGSGEIGCRRADSRRHSIRQSP